jgi:hypothetical protein
LPEQVGEQVLVEIRKAAAVGISAVIIAGIVPVIALRRSLGAGLVDLAGVEATPLFGIAKEIIGSRDGFELVFSRPVARIEIGMEGLGELSVGLLNFIRRGCRRYPQDLIRTAQRGALAPVSLAQRGIAALIQFCCGRDKNKISVGAGCTIFFWLRPAVRAAGK